MMYVLLLAHLVAAPDLFDVSSVPVKDEEQQAYFAVVDANRTADLCVQNGRDLHIRLDNGKEHMFVLPEGVSAYDIYDIDGDSRSEVIAIRGGQVLAFDPLLVSGEQSTGRLLFEANSLYAMEMAEPSPQVLVKTFQQKLTLLLPQPDSLTVYTLDGTILDRFFDLPDVPRVFDEFMSDTGFRPEVEPREVSWTYVSQDSKLIPGLPPELQPPDVPFAIPVDGLDYLNEKEFLSFPYRSSTGKYSGSWDRVIVSEDSNRIQYANLRNDENGNTLVFMVDVPLVAGKQDWSGAEGGPVRRYPGRLSTRPVSGAFSILAVRPDFDGDGFMDLILWDAPKPGMSVESIMRTVVSRSWPLRLTIHTYSPDKQRFEPKPAYAINYKVPITWFLESGPFRNFSLADFDGDGKTDLALSTDEKEYRVWLAASGFSRDPDWIHTFPEPIEETLQTAELSGDGRHSILLRGEKNLYLLQAR